MVRPLVSVKRYALLNSRIQEQVILNLCGFAHAYLLRELITFIFL